MISAVVISSIISLILIAIKILTPGEFDTPVSFPNQAILVDTPEEGIRITRPRISLEDIVSDHFKPDDFEGSWLSGKTLATYSANKRLQGLHRLTRPFFSLPEYSAQKTLSSL